MTGPRIKFDETPTQIKIKLEPEQVSISPLGNDAFIIINIGGQRFDALVPTHTLGLGYRYVPAARMGTIGEKVLLYFPVSNEGRPTWEISEEDLNQVLLD